MAFGGDVDHNRIPELIRSLTRTHWRPTTGLRLYDGRHSYQRKLQPLLDRLGTLLFGSR